MIICFTLDRPASTARGEGRWSTRSATSHEERRGSFRQSASRLSRLTGMESGLSHRGGSHGSEEARSGGGLDLLFARRNESVRVGLAFVRLKSVDFSRLH